jgi:hypothetical protein
VLRIVVDEFGWPDELEAVILNWINSQVGIEVFREAMSHPSTFRRLALRLAGSPGYTETQLVNFFSEVISWEELEQDGIEPDDYHWGEINRRWTQFLHSSHKNIPIKFRRVS